MGCKQSTSKEAASTSAPPTKAAPVDATLPPGETHTGAESAVSAGTGKDPMSPAQQIANANPPKSAMKKRPPTQEPTVATPRGSQKCEGRVGSTAPKDALEPMDDDEDETGVMDRSFVKEDLAGSFRNLSFVSEKGDCRVEKGVMAPSAPKIPIPASSSDRASSKSASDVDLLSPHSSDGELVLVCMDCGREINEREAGMLCPVTAKLHG